MGILGEVFKVLTGGGGQNSPQQAGGFSPNAFPQRQKFFCKYCGMDFPDVRTLTVNPCKCHPAGGNSRHELYEGGEKSQYTCKYCGMSYRSLRDLTTNICQRHPSGKGRHAPAL